MPLHDISYRHWDGVHLGLAHRRWAIARQGLTACLRHKWLRHVVVLCWSSALAMAGLMFLVGQLLVADSIVVQWVGNFNPGLQTFAQMLTRWLEQHPEISVRTTQNVLFHYYNTGLLRAGFFVLGMAIPALITRDLASNAIIIYSSKAVSRGDYLLGKFAMAFGLLGLTLLGPLCAAWFLGNLLSPDWRFFWHGRAALLHAVSFSLLSMTVLGVMALAVSALSTRQRTTTAIWYVWWILGGVMAPMAQAQPWLRHLSMNYNLDQIALAVFRPGNDITTAQESIPVLGELLRNIRPSTLAALNAPSLTGAVITALVLLGGAALILHKRVRPA